MLSRSVPSSWIVVAFGAALSAGFGRAAGEDLAPENSKNRITLVEAVETALLQNKEVMAAALGPEIAIQQVKEAKAGFDPAFQSSVGYDSSRRPLNTQEFLATGIDPATRPEGTAGRDFSESTFSYSAGVVGLLPTGAQYDLGVKGNRLANDLNISQPPSLFYPEYDAFAGLTLTQPLLKDGGFKANLAPLQVARAEHRIAILGSQEKAEEVALAIAVRYFEAAFSLQNVAIAAESTALAANLEDENRRRFESGVGSNLDINEARAAVAHRTDEMEQARAKLVESLAELRKLIGQSPGGDSSLLLPADGGHLPEPVSDRPGLITRARAHRHDYRKALAEVEKLSIQLQYARNQKLPELDLTATLGALGLAESADRAFSRAGDNDQLAWSVGVELRVPLGGRAANAKVAAADLRKVQAVMAVERLEQEITIDITTQLQTIAIHRRRMASATTAAELAAERLSAESAKLEKGTSTSYNVLTAQRDLTEAKVRGESAKADYLRAVARLSHLQGTLLQDLGFRTNP